MQKRLFQEPLLLDVVGEQEELRDRLVVIELRQEGRQDLGLGDRLVGAREIGAVAPVLSAAEKEHLDAGLPALLHEAEDVRLLDGMRD